MNYLKYRNHYRTEQQLSQVLLSSWVSRLRLRHRQLMAFGNRFVGSIYLDILAGHIPHRQPAVRQHSRPCQPLQFQPSRQVRRGKSELQQKLWSSLGNSPNKALLESHARDWFNWYIGHALDFASLSLDLWKETIPTRLPSFGFLARSLGLTVSFRYETDDWWVTQSHTTLFTFFIEKCNLALTISW